MLTRAAKKFFSYTIKAGVVVLAVLFIYHQFLEKGDSLNRFRSLIRNINETRVWVIMSIVVVLMFINWILESIKWQYLIRAVSKITVWQSIEAVFCGLTWAIFTPNRLGEYAGRVLFLPNRKRIHGVFAMAVGAFGQSVITNVLGASALMWYLYTYSHLNIFIYIWIFVSAILFMVFFLVLFFHIQWLVILLDKVAWIRKYHRFFDIMGRYTKAELFEIMAFCLTRFCVFSFQYYLVIHLLIPEIPAVQMMLMVLILFFVQSALPSLDLIDFTVRSATATVLFAHLTNQSLAVVAAVSSIWFINLIIPAILGSVFVFKLKFFDRNV